VERFELFAREKLEEYHRAIADALPPHEWEGKIVTSRDYKNIGTMWAPIYREITIRGVVETYRAAENQKRKPYAVAIGEPIVRLLNKNGKPGQRLEKLNWERLDGCSVWTLEQEQ
jgi:hypothetical protein